MDDLNKRRALINIFVHSVYLYDDHFTIIINASKKPLSIDNIPLDEIEETFEGENEGPEGCSSMATPAPPKKRTHPPCGDERDFYFTAEGNRTLLSHLGCFWGSKQHQKETTATT